MGHVPLPPSSLASFMTVKQPVHVMMNTPKCTLIFFGAGSFRISLKCTCDGGQLNYNN